MERKRQTSEAAPELWECQTGDARTSGYLDYQKGGEGGLHFSTHLPELAEVRLACEIGNFRVAVELLDGKGSTVVPPKIVESFDGWIDRLKVGV